MSDKNDYHVDLYKQFGIAEPAPFDSSLPIYVAEAHNELKLIICHHLQTHGFSNIRSARDGKTALDHLQTHPAVLAIAGDSLPLVSGLDMLKDLLEEPSLTRPAFVYLTQPLNKNELMFALENGVDDFLVKPIAPADIVPKLKSAYQAFTNPKNPERVYEFAKIQLRSNRLDEAYAVYDALAASANHAARPFVGMARILLRQEKIIEALKKCSIGIERNNNYVHAYALRGEIYLKMNENEKALLDLKKSIALSPLNLKRYEVCTELLIRLNMIDNAAAILETAIQSGLRHPYIVERLGYCFFTKKDYTEALKYLKEANRLEPDNASFANSLAICYRDSRDYEKSIQIYNLILKKDPENHLVLFNKVITLLLLEKKDEAVKILKRIIKLDPTYKKAYEKLAELGESATKEAS